ncbi:MAG: IS30 family transposase [Bacteroidaceae bacterium]|nr:IS30 family transposase [Bacteroidaceae bacterium]
MYKHLTQEQRYYIYVERQKGSTQKSIAEAIGVSHSTVCRELKRNGGRNKSYNFIRAQEKAERRAHRAPGNRAVSAILKWRVRELITEEQWSPKQIAGRLKLEGHSISHESIYAMIRRDETGELALHCRHKMKYSRKPSRRHVTKTTNIRNRVSIHQRPVEADGTRFGDWEMDLIVDKDQNAILTLVERSSDRFLMERLKYGKQALPLAKVAWRLLLPYKGEGLKTITTDNGSEFAAHEWLAKKLGVPVYFTDAYSSWQKGNIENTNKLIRQYIPKGTDISRITDRKIADIQAKINRRPREKLNFLTPNEVFFKHYV